MNPIPVIPTEIGYLTALTDLNSDTIIPIHCKIELSLLAKSTSFRQRLDSWQRWEVSIHFKRVIKTKKTLLSIQARIHSHQSQQKLGTWKVWTFYISQQINTRITNNYLDGCSLTALPTEIGRLTSLTTLNNKHEKILTHQTYRNNIWEFPHNLTIRVHIVNFTFDGIQQPVKQLCELHISRRDISGVQCWLVWNTPTQFEKFQQNKRKLHKILQRATRASAVKECLCAW